MSNCSCRTRVLLFCLGFILFAGAGFADAGDSPLPLTEGRNPAQTAITGDTALDRADRLALSGDVSSIESAIQRYQSLVSGATSPVEVHWRLSRAWFNIYDELPRPDQNARRKEAAKTAQSWAEKGLEIESESMESRYWLAMALLARADLESVFTFLGNVRKVIKLVRQVQQKMPELDDGGPDRLLAIFLHELPWPWKDEDQSFKHIQTALLLASYRCANHDLAARLYIKRKEWTLADRSIKLLENRKCTASSPMWDKIYQSHGRELRSLFVTEQKS